MRSYFLPLTSGCSNNTCTFCNRWGEKLQIRDIDDIKKEIGALALFMKSGLTMPVASRRSSTPLPKSGTVKACFSSIATPSFTPSPSSKKPCSILTANDRAFNVLPLMPPRRTSCAVLSTS